MKPILKLNFSDFWGGFNPKDNYFINVLSRKFDIKIVDDPDFLIYSVYGYNFRKYDCIRILFTGENVRPDINECDWAFSFDYEKYNGKNIRFPLYALYGDIEKLKEPKDVEKIIKSKNKFCCFLVSNPKGRERIEFFKKLSKYKKVDSGGKVLNNIGYRVKDRFDFIKDYKFIIAFENSSYPGYTTEKIFQPMKVHTIPIYWGNPKIETDFNPKSFINVHEYKDFDQVVEKIIEIDNNIELYKKILAQPYYSDNIIPEHITEEYFLENFEKIYRKKDSIKPIARTWRKIIVEGKILKNKLRARIYGKNRWNA